MSLPGRILEAASAIVGRLLVLLIIGLRRRRRRHLGEDIRLAQQVIVLEHIQMLDHLKFLIFCRGTRGFVAQRSSNPNAQRQEQRHRKGQPRLRYQPPEPCRLRFSSDPLPQARVESERRLVDRHFVENGPELAKLSGARAAPLARKQVFLGVLPLRRIGPAIEIRNQFFRNIFTLHDALPSPALVRTGWVTSGASSTRRVSYERSK